jgi:hypothetical protein
MKIAADIDPAWFIRDSNGMYPVKYPIPREK